jgi:hypothetical protein
MNIINEKPLKVFCFSYFFVILASCCFGQQYDSVSIADSAFTYSDDDFQEDAQSYAAPDSSRISARTFDENGLKNLKSDEALQYKEAPTIAESLFDRFIKLLGQFLDSLVQGAVTTNWGRVISYLLGLGLLVVLIMMLLKVNAFKVFYGGQAASSMPYHVLDENIHEMDFDALIQEAIGSGEYRKATRLVFLNALKILADKNFIHWEQGKTNHDYLSEVTAAELKPGFNELNYYFEYAWYGNFNINHEKFLKVQQEFNTWRERIR